MENLFTGTTKFRGRKYPILWTGEKAQHIVDNYLLNNNETLHIEIQKALQTATNYALTNGIVGYKEFSGYTLEIIWKLKNSKAMINTAHTKQSTPRLLLKGKGIGTNKKQKIIFTEDMIDERTHKFIVDGGITIEGYVKFQNKILNEKAKNKKY